MTMLKVKAYKYEESSDKVKKILKQRALEDMSEIHDYVFREDTNWILQHELKQVSLRINYSLSYCQGDGLRVTGELDLAECLEYEKIKQALTPKELKRIAHYLSETISTTDLSSHRNYCFFSRHDYDFADEIIGYLEDIRYTNIDIDLINKFQKLVIDFFAEKCYDWEKEGYDYIYPDLSEDEFAEYYFDYYFDERGQELEGEELAS